MTLLHSQVWETLAYRTKSRTWKILPDTSIKGAWFEGDALSHVPQKQVSLCISVQGCIYIEEECCEENRQYIELLNTTSQS